MIELVSNKEVVHISFDMWNTLISPNPNYKKERNIFMGLYFGVEVSEVEHVCEKVKDIGNTLIETTGFSLPAVHVIEWVGRHFDCRFDRHQALKLQKQIDDLFLKYPPIIQIGIVDMLKKLNMKGYSLSITSNTTMTTGKTLNDACEIISDQFVFTRFSDLVGFGKPSRLIYEHVLDTVCILKNKQVDPNEILHVGDNKEADFLGAHRMGFQTIYVQNPQDTVEKMRKYTND